MKTMRRNTAPPAARTRMATPAALLIAGSFLGLALAGCGGGDDASPTGPPGDPLPLLSYAPIAGAWVGSASELVGEDSRTFSVRLALGETASSGDSVGTARYEAKDGSFECSGPLFASRVEGDVYRVRQDITQGTGCSAGQVRLTHEEEDSRLLWDYFIGGEHSATGVLSRE